MNLIYATMGTQPVSRVAALGAMAFVLAILLLF
jgi:hypothetical protein